MRAFLLSGGPFKILTSGSNTDSEILTGDAKIAGRVATVVMQMEEGSRILEESGSRYIPEHRRLRAIKTSFDLHKCRGKVRYLTARRDFEGSGFVAGHVELSW